MKEKIFNIIQIGDKSNRISRSFDFFITITIICNIIVTFMETFSQLSAFSTLFTVVEYLTVSIFCIEYILRIWTANYLWLISSWSTPTCSPIRSATERTSSASCWIALRRSSSFSISVITGAASTPFFARRRMDISSCVLKMPSHTYP